MNPPEKSDEFFAAFYNLLIATSPEAASKFRETDMVAQARMLRASVSILADYGTGGQGDYLLKLAERHGKGGKDIAPRLYSVWLDCLVQTAKRFDAKFSAEVEAAWREVFSKGIEVMTSRYEEG